MYSLLVMTISGSILALLLMGLRYTVLRKMPSTVYYYAWLLVLLRFTLPLPGLVPTTGEAAPSTPSSAVPAVYSENYDQENIRHDSGSVQHEVIKTASTESAESHISLNATETKEMTVSENAPKAAVSIDWKSPKLWLSIWALGAVISMGFTVFSYLRFNFNLKRDLMEPDSFTKSV